MPISLPFHRKIDLEIVPSILTWMLHILDETQPISLSGYSIMMPAYMIDVITKRILEVGQLPDGYGPLVVSDDYKTVTWLGIPIYFIGPSHEVWFSSATWYAHTPSRCWCYSLDPDLNQFVTSTH